MSAVIETTRTTVNVPLPVSGIPPKQNRKFRDENTVNRFLATNKGYEYINGKVEKKKIPSAKESGVATRLSAELGIFLKKNKIGRVYNEAHFQIRTNKRIPDVAFVSTSRIPTDGEPSQLWEIAPDLAIEVISPSDSYIKVFDKIDDYFAANVKQGWIINPIKKTFTIYFSPTETKILTEKETLICEDILPNFRLKLNDIFID
jgi:Uma2 family endonuclease